MDGDFERFLDDHDPNPERWMFSALERLDDERGEDQEMSASERERRQNEIEKEYKRRACNRLARLTNEMMATKHERRQDDVKAMELESMPDSNSQKVHLLARHGNMCYERCEATGKKGDLDRSVATFRRALKLPGLDVAMVASLLDDLGIGLATYSFKFRLFDDIDEAIDLLQNSVNRRKDDDLSMPECLSTLGSALMLRFDHAGKLEDIDKSVTAHQQAVKLSESHPSHLIFLANYGDSLCCRFESTGHIADLENAIHAHRRAVDLTTPDDQLLPWRLGCLGRSLRNKFDHLGHVQDIDAAIEASQRAAYLTASSHSVCARHLDSIGTNLALRVTRFGGLESLDKAINAHERAIRLTPEDHIRMPQYLHNLSGSLMRRFYETQRLEDINKALSALKRAIALIPDKRSYLPTFLTCLASCYSCRFENGGDLGDLEKSISAQQRAVDLTPEGHSRRASFLHNLGNSLCAQYRYTDSFDSVEQATIVLRQAVNMTPSDHAQLLKRLTSLGTILRCRFGGTGDPADLNEAISMGKRAVELTTYDSIALPGCLASLGQSLVRRFQDAGDVVDIEDAAAALAKSIEITPEGNPHLSGRLATYGTARRDQYELTGSLDYLADAVAAHSKALELIFEDHPRFADYLDNLGASLSARGVATKNMEDIERAIEMQRRAVKLSPNDHPQTVAIIKSLGSTYCNLVREKFSISDCVEALKIFHTAAFAKGSFSESLKAAKVLVRMVDMYPAVKGAHDIDILSVYARILESIPKVAWVGHIFSKRYKELSKLMDHVGMAVAAAIEAGKNTLALEWFEAGRAIVWSQVQNLRTPHDELFEWYPEEAKNFVQVAADLERATKREALVDDDADEGMIRKSLEEQGISHRRLATRYEALVEEIRGLPGLDGFLRPRGIEQLKAAARESLVVCINVDLKRCSALLLPEASTGKDVHHVPLPDLSLMCCTVWKSTLDSYRRQEAQQARAGYLSPFTLDDSAEEPPEAIILRLLAEMWNWVVKPVLDAVEGIGAAEEGLLHITWCMSDDLSFLPLHAAGLYDSEDDATKAFNRIVSSYIPTLASILPRGSPRAQADEQTGKISVVIQPDSPASSTMPALRGTITEADKIRAHIPANDFTLLEGAAGTVSNVLDAMQHHPWVHLACHGIQNAAEPLESALVLHDGRLTLSKMMETSLPNAELAFLSACETAMGDSNVPNEAVHLAAGMLGAGYKTVIGTLWSIGDYEAPLVADVFYRTLLQEKRTTGKLDAAYALHKAVEALRKKVGEREFVRWMPFVHYGLRDPSASMSKEDIQKKEHV
ncbi:hypothetical protein CYLTODRAFT_374646 [Cylindrobasidium torrendii FP15055 ss-10]|uniref:CHAT domain-containing protein n=1 Tax=Cylindrobasidium torrendii FP15055 ss-10 TaxID=1314674 RepID=A0A0D7BCR4_9AGAR|nr:hypothetical protein CYLTODRAFT_374646 [Cylindrobasidium torrendii FP15055 ss-10]